VTRLLAAILLAAGVACAPPPAPLPGDYHGSDADLTVTRLGHAGLVLELGAHVFLVDPWLHGGVFLRQREGLGLHPDAFPAISAVLLTHDDGTRVDRAALARLARVVPDLVAPPPLAERLAGHRFHAVSALAWWQDVTIDGVRITAVPARGNGYVLRAQDLVVYAAGDPGDATAFDEIRKAVGRIDVVLLPIGERRVFGVRTDFGPEQAASAAAALGARRVVPIAYGAAGTFPFVTFASDPVPRFRRAAAAAGVEPRSIVVLEPGESWHYYR
jgi:L-ascorbate metabolism protein UlaG (beta-lactamase superfamily)